MTVHEFFKEVFIGEVEKVEIYQHRDNDYFYLKLNNFISNGPPKFDADEYNLVGKFFIPNLILNCKIKKILFKHVSSTLVLVVN